MQRSEGIGPENLSCAAGGNPKRYGVADERQVWTSFS